jgi:hypothetical protein
MKQTILLWNEMNIPKKKLILKFLLFLVVIIPARVSSQVVYTESFDGTTFVPAGWTNLLISGSNSWSRVTSGTNPAQLPQSGAGEAKFDSYDYSGGVRALITPPFSLQNNTSGASVSFWMYRDNGYNTDPDKIDVYYNSAANLTGATSLGTIHRAIGLTPTVTANGWYQYSFSIPNTFTSSTSYLILQATSAYGNNIFIDDVSWTGYPPVCSGTPSTPVISISTPSGCPSGLNITTTGNSNELGISYQWQASPTSGGTYTSIPSATTTAYAGSPSSTAFYRMVTTCSVSTLSSTTSVVSYTVVNPGPCVCTTYGSSSSTSAFDEDIFNVVFGTLSNPSTCTTTAPGPGSVNKRYSNYAGFVTAPDICRGAAIPFTVNIGTCNGWYGMRFKIYIDYNQNGSFSDAGEEVHSNTSAIQGNNTGTVTIPLTATTGLTRMRIIASEATISSPIGSYSYGETEDYCITILANPTIGLSASTGSICPGIGFSVSASGASTYSINGGPGTVSGSNATLTPIASSVYTITGTGSNGCISPITAGATASITTLAAPNLTTSATSTGICVGGSATLNVTGANSYTWSPSTISNSLVVSPMATTIYTVSGTGTNVCNGVSTLTMIVNPLPTVSVNSGTLCAGKAFTFVPTGAATYVYSSGSNTVSPTSTGSYSVTGISNQGCVSASPAVSTITVVALPVITVNSGSICSGTPFVMLPTGASSYTFSGTGANPVSPTVTTSYSVTGTASTGCVSLPVVSNITVFALPTVSIASSSSVSCSGEPVTLTAAGATSYSWNTGGNTSSITDNPTVTTNYVVIGADANGCINFNNVTVTVNPLPNLTVSGNTFICQGSTATVTAGGALNYAWSNGSTTGSVTVNPTVTTTYSVIGTNTFGCTKLLTHTVNVNTAFLTVSNNTTVCAGKSTTLTAIGATTYTWSTGTPFANLVVTPSVTISYTMNATGNGCPFSAVVTVTVNSNPVVVASISPTLICKGESASMSASGANSYTWSNGATGTLVVVTPTTDLTFNYTAVGENSNGCTATSNQVTLKVERCTGISQENHNAIINVFPNPNNGIFNIQFVNNDNKEIRIYDITGKAVYSAIISSEKVEINLDEHPAGIYMLMVSSHDGTNFLKIIKN